VAAEVGTVALQWTSALALGVPELDAQHRELFRRVDRLLDAVLAKDREAAASTVAFLNAFVGTHFAAEERLMEETAYPDQPAHVAEHRAFAAALLDIDDQLRREGPSAALVYRLEREAVAWLEDHVCRVDVALARHLRGRTRPAARLA
jgi:hemerythrin